MQGAIKAHDEAVSMLDTSRGVRRYGTPSVGWYDRLVSASLRGIIKVWEVQQADIRGSITLLPLAKVNHLRIIICFFPLDLRWWSEKTVNFQGSISGYRASIPRLDYLRIMILIVSIPLSKAIDLKKKNLS